MPLYLDLWQTPLWSSPVDSFYEWKKLGQKEKQPYAIALANRSLMALAGLWETWKSPADETIRSFTIVTTTPNELCAELHIGTPSYARMSRPGHHSAAKRSLPLLTERSPFALAGLSALEGTR